MPLHLVYADWLQLRGEARGRLIVLHHERDMADDAQTYQRLRRRIQSLFAAYPEELHGPLALTGYHYRLGFLRAVALHEVPRRDALQAALAHPAYCLLETLHVPQAAVARVQRVVDLLARDITVTARPLDRSLRADTVIASLDVETVHDQRYASVEVIDGLPALGECHELVMRVTIGNRRWSHGAGYPLSEEYFSDDPLRSRWYPLDATADALTCELWFRDRGDDDTTVDVSYAGTAALPATGAVRMLLRHCPPHDGLPFTPTATGTGSATVGPTLDTPAHAVCPGIGVLGYDRLYRPGHSPQPLQLAPPRTGLPTQAAGGRDGTLVARYSPRRDDDPETKGWLGFFVPPASYAHRPYRHHITGMSVLSEQRVAVVAAMFRSAHSELHVFDARTGEERWQVNVPKPLRFNTTWSMVEHAGALHVLEAGVVTSYDIATGTPVDRWSLPVPLLSVGHYGVGHPVFHPRPGRAAWLSCVANGRVRRSVIGWIDRDGRHGEVAIPEGGYTLDTHSFGKVAVLEDGRILAVGDSVWLVDPADPTPRRLAAAGNYCAPLQVTREGTRWRLWSAGGPWYVELD